MKIADLKETKSHVGRRVTQCVDAQRNRLM